MLQKKNFVKGINSDIADELLPNGMDRYRLNVRVISPENGDMGYIETMNGNTLVSYELPSGTNICIGAREYERFGKVYYFVFNDADNHSILEYDIAQNAINLVLMGSFLNFSTDNLITGINFIELDPNNHLLYWTDNLNEPRKLNIEKAKYYSAGDYTNGYKYPFDPSWINRIKIPPTIPTYTWYNDTTKQVNYLINKMFTFKARFVYDDNEISACSPISPYSYQNTYGASPSEPIITQDNRIDITIPTGSSIVKRIQILAKEVNDVNYYQIADINKYEYSISDNTTYVYEWYNDNITIPILVDESIKLFDNVPLKSQSQEIITNRIMDGLVTEGYDSVEIDMVINVDNTPVLIDNNGVLAQRSYLKSGGIYTYGIVYYDSANRSGVSNINHGNTTDLQSNGRYGTTLHYPFLNDPIYGQHLPSEYLPTFWNIYNNPPEWATHYQIVRSKNNDSDKFWQFSCGPVMYVDSSGSDIGQPWWPEKTIVRLYINNTYGIFQDEYGVSGIPFEPVRGDRVRIISPPDYTHIGGYPAQIVYSPGDGITYSPYSISGFSTTMYDFMDLEIIKFSASGGYIEVLKTSIVPDGDPPPVIRPGSLIEVYTPSSSSVNSSIIMNEIGELFDITTDAYGNRVHAGRSSNQSIIPSITTLNPSPTTLWLEVDSGSILLGANLKVDGGSYSGYGSVTSVIPNVPVVGTDTIVVTVGSIIGTYSSGPSNLILPASGEFQSGDVYRPYVNMPWRMSNFGVPVDGTPAYPGPYTPYTYRVYSYIEAMNASYFFPSAATDYGRPNKVDPNFRQITRPSTIRYSERFVPETNINGLSSVYDTSFETYEDQYGGIYKLYGEDQRLICFQELRIGQVPVHQVIYNAQDLTQTVGASEVVLNPQMIYYAGVYGIGKNPESFAVYAKSKYFLDMKRGALCRLSVDGITPISKTAFQDKFITEMCNNRINKVGNTPRAYGVFDVKFNEYIISFADYTYLDGKKFKTTPGDTIAFNEKINEFTTHYSFLPDFMCSAGVNIVSIKDGELYTHNTNKAQSEFYGSLNYPEVWVVLNANPENVKVFESIGLACVDAWEAYEITTPNGQLSNLIITDFQFKENLNYAPIWRDVNTPNLEPGTELFEGDPMRDRTFLVKLIFNQLKPFTFDLMKTKMYSVDLKYIVSNLHNR